MSANNAVSTWNSNLGRLQNGWGYLKRRRAQSARPDKSAKHGGRGSVEAARCIKRRIEEFPCEIWILGKHVRVPVANHDLSHHLYTSTPRYGHEYAAVTPISTVLVIVDWETIPTKGILKYDSLSLQVLE